MKRTKLSIPELVSLAISAGALAVSIWAVVESRAASTQARRSEVRAEASARIDGFRRSYSKASCVLNIAGMHSGQAKFEQYKANLDDLQGMLFQLQTSRVGTLDAFEAQLDSSTAAFGRLDDEIVQFKTSLSSEEIGKVNSVCDL